MGSNVQDFIADDIMIHHASGIEHLRKDDNEVDAELNIALEVNLTICAI